MIYQMFEGRVIDSVLINFSPLNPFPNMPLTERFHKNGQAAFA